VLAALGWRATIAPGIMPRGGDEFDYFLRILLALALYVFCYGMSAVLLRFYLFADKVRALYNWVLTLVLLGLGSTLPWIVAFIIYSNRMSRQGGLDWWLLPNPFWAASELDRRSSREEMTVVCFLFLGVWALILAALSVRWVGVQMARFQPARPSTPRPATVPAAATEIPLAAPVEAE
jgi:hypothetical protein